MKGVKKDAERFVINQTTLFELSIITINYNGLALTCDFLNSVRTNLKGLHYECLVLDNGSSINEAVKLQLYFPEFTIFRSEANLGFAGGNNYCIQHAKGRYLYFLNNDTLLLDNSVTYLIDYLNQHPKIGACSPKILFQNPVGTIQFAGFTAMSTITLRNKGVGYLKPDKGQYDIPNQTHYLHGAAMMVRKSALDCVGPMPEAYFLYYEETDWSETFKRNGFELWYLPLTSIIHREGKTVGTNSLIKQYYMTRNRLLFAKRNRSRGQFTVFFLYFILFVCTKELFLFLIKGQTSHFKATAIGLIDFITHRYGTKPIQ